MIDRQEVAVCVQQRRDDDVRWLALTIRQALKLVVSEIERRYGLDSVSSAERKRMYDRIRAEIEGEHKRQ